MRQEVDSPFAPDMTKAGQTAERKVPLRRHPRARRNDCVLVVVPKDSFPRVKTASNYLLERLARRDSHTEDVSRETLPG